VLDSAGEDVISPEASALVEAELGVGHGIGCFTLSTLMYSSAFWWLGKRILKALFKGIAYLYRASKMAAKSNQVF
jgi:hypothetical protein